MKNHKTSKIAYYLCAALIPICVMFIVYKALEIYPFGDKSLLSMDLWGQYLPMIAEQARESLTDSLFSWNGALGYNAFAQNAYYCNSLFNLLLRPFEGEALINALDYLILIKFGLASLTCSMYMSFHFKKKSVIFIAGSIAYGLCSYCIAYLAQIMWFDLIIYLPLILIGLEKLIFQNKPLMYCITLAISIYSNFYIAFSLCIFIVIYFIVIMVEKCYQLKRKENLLTTARFAAYSLLSGALSAFSILPIYFAINHTVAADAAHPDNIIAYHNLSDYIYSLFPFTKLSWEYDVPNINTGIFVLILLPLFFFNSKITFRKKMVYGGLLSFLYLSMNLNILNFVWHGFHFPNQLPGRWTFIFSFIVILIALDGLVHSKGISPKTTFLSWFGAIILFEIARSAITAENWLYNQEQLTKEFFYLTVMLTLYALVLFLWRFNKKTKSSESVANKNYIKAADSAENLIEQDFYNAAPTENSKISSTDSYEETLNNNIDCFDVEPIKNEHSVDLSAVNFVTNAVPTENSKISSTDSDEETLNNNTDYFDVEPIKNEHCVDLSAVNSVANTEQFENFEAKSLASEYDSNTAPAEHTDAILNSEASKYEQQSDILPTAYISTRNKRERIKFAQIALTAIMILDVAVNAIVAGTRYTRTSDLKSYCATGNEIGDYIVQYDCGNDDFYRLELNNGFTFNSGQLFDYKGIGYYSSTMNGNMFKLFRNFGCRVYAENVSTVFNCSSPVLNSFFSIKYIVERTGNYNIPGMKLETDYDNCDVYENSYFLPLAFKVDDSILNWLPLKNETWRGIEEQNKLVNLAYGEDINVFNELSPTISLNNAELKETLKWETSIYSFIDPNLPLNFNYSFTCNKNGPVYMQQNFYTGTMTIECNGNIQNVDLGNERYKCVGNFNEGDVITVNVAIDPSPYYVRCGLNLFTFDEQKYQTVIDSLNAESLKVTDFSNTKINGTINLSEDGIIYTSIPNDGGWSVYSDGQKVDIVEIGESLVGFKLAAGTHQIEFSYTVPGLVIGLIISACALVIIILIVLLKRKKQKIMPNK